MSRRIDTGTAAVDDLDIPWRPEADPVLAHREKPSQDRLYLGKSGDDYLTRLMKYIPAELVALYLTMNSMVEPKTNWTAYWITFGIVYVLVPIFYWRMTQTRIKTTLWSQVVTKFTCISTVGFRYWRPL